MLLFWVKPFFRSVFAASPEKFTLTLWLRHFTRLSSGQVIGTTAGLSQGVTFVKENGNNWLQKFQTILLTHCHLPCCSELLNSRWGWVFDLLKIYQGSLLLSLWPSKLRGGVATAWKQWEFGDLREQEVDKRLCWLCRLTVLAGCQLRECNIICSKLPAHTKWHGAVSDSSFSCHPEHTSAKKNAHTLFFSNQPNTHSNASQFYINFPRIYTVHVSWNPREYVLYVCNNSLRTLIECMQLCFFFSVPFCRYACLWLFIMIFSGL